MILRKALSIVILSGVLLLPSVVSARFFGFERSLGDGRNRSLPARASYFEARQDIFSWFPPASSTGTATSTTGFYCVQVITYARNPATGQIQQFPTPCDVPAGWQVVPYPTYSF